MDFGIWFGFVAFVYHKMDKKVKEKEGGREEKRKRGKEGKKKKQGRDRQRQGSLNNQKPWVSH